MTRRCPPVLALISLFSLLQTAQASSSSLEAWRYAGASTRHCCWDNPKYHEAFQGDAAHYAARSWSASADAGGSLSHGQISADVSASSDVRNWAYVEATGEARDYWKDTFTVTSGSLAWGTPVALDLTVELDATVMTQGYGKGYALAVIGTGLDAGWIVGVDTRVLGAGSHRASGTFMTHVGSSVTLVGQLASRAWAESAAGGGTGSASTQTSARFTVSAATAGADYVAASGQRYGAVVPTVPEPSGWLLALIGGAGVALRRGLRR